MELNVKDLGKRIGRRREELKIKQNILAEMLDISNNHMSCIENGRERPSLRLFVQICDVLNVTPDYLLLGNMHSSNVSRDILDMLRLCTDRDITLIRNLLQCMVDTPLDNLNSDKLKKR